MGPAGILLLVRTKRSVLKADPTQIGRNHLASRDHLRGSPLYIGEIVSDYKEIHGNSKERVEGICEDRSIPQREPSDFQNFPNLLACRPRAFLGLGQLLKFMYEDLDMSKYSKHYRN
jgi:hypothetical protein